MKQMERKTIVKLCVAALIVVLSIVFASGLFSGGSLIYHLKNRGELGPLSRSDISYQMAQAPEATSQDGTVNASDWASVYPYISATMGDNSKNSYVVDYLEEDPYLVNIYEGYGFAKDYGSARGHEYCLTDVGKTQRPHPKANCLTCKTPNFAKLVNDQGVGVYSMPFDEVMAMMEENISCYTCHGNDAGNGGAMVVTHSYVNKALGDSVNDIDPATLSKEAPDGPARRELCLDFLRHLLSDDCQGMLHLAGACSVTGALSGYAPGAAEAQMEAALRSGMPAVPGCFDRTWVQAVEPIVRKFLLGEGDAADLWPSVRARLQQNPEHCFVP